MEELILLRNGCTVIGDFFFPLGKALCAPDRWLRAKQLHLSYRLCIVIPDWLIARQKNIKSSFTIQTLSCGCVASRREWKHRAKKLKKKLSQLKLFLQKHPFGQQSEEERKKKRLRGSNWTKYANQLTDHCRGRTYRRSFSRTSYKTHIWLAGCAISNAINCFFQNLRTYTE